MRFLIFGVLIAAAVATVTYALMKRQPVDVYAMPMERVYAKLAAVHTKGGDGTFIGTAPIAPSGNGRDKVYWLSVVSHGARKCTLGLAPYPDDAAQTHITVTCKGGVLSDGAAAGVAHNLFRNAVIEKLDSTLSGRSFDQRRSMGTTAASWPDDGVDGSYGTAVKQSIQMQHDFAEMDLISKDMEQDKQRQRKWDEFNGAHDPDFGDPTTRFVE